MAKEPEPSMEDILSSIREIISDDEQPPAAPPPSAAGETVELGAALTPEQPPVVPAGPVRDPIHRPQAQGIRLMNDETEIAGINSFAELDSAIRLGRMGDTLGDVVLTVLKPMLKDWIDENLPNMVEDQIQREIQRISESGRRKRVVEDLGDMPL